LSTLTFDKLLFHEIYRGELSKEFELNFSKKFSISYSEFLQLKFKEHNENTKTLAKFIDLKEKELIVHLKEYSIIKTFNINNWREYVAGNMFWFILKAFFAAIGTFPVFYIVGYLILYGYFFGQTENALLEIVMKNVPFSSISCYIAGFIFSGIVAFFISLYRLKGLGIPFVIFGFIYFLFASTISLSLILINTNSSLSLPEILKFMLVWLFPILASLLIIFIFYLTNILVKHYKIIGIVTISCSAIPIFLPRVLGLFLSIIIYIISVILLSGVIIKFVERRPHFSITKRKKVSRQNQANFKFTIAEFFFLILLATALIVVIIIPIFCFILFSTGNYISSTLSLVGLTRNEEIRINGTTINGKLVAENEHYLYISTTSRTLIEISRDSSIQITRPNELKVYSGKSDNWNVSIKVSIKDEELWYSGVLKNISSNQTRKLTYKLDNLDEVTLTNVNPKMDYYILDKLSPGNFKEFTSIQLSWFSSNGPSEQEKILLTVSND